MADHDLFFSRTGMDRGRVQQTVDQALKGADDGELYLEYSQSESFSFDDNRLKAATFDTSQGFGLRAVAGVRVIAGSSTQTGSWKSMTCRGEGVVVPEEVSWYMKESTPSMETRLWSTTTSPNAFRVLVPS